MPPAKAGGVCLVTLKRFAFLGRGRSRRTVRGRLRTLCGGLFYLCGSELEVRSHVGDLDLDGLTLVAVVVLPAALDKLLLNRLTRRRCLRGPAPPGMANGMAKR